MEIGQGLQNRFTYGGNLLFIQPAKQKQAAVFSIYSLLQPNTNSLTIFDSIKGNVSAKNNTRLRVQKEKFKPTSDALHLKAHPFPILERPFLKELSFYVIYLVRENQVCGTEKQPGGGVLSEQCFCTDHSPFSITSPPSGHLCFKR